MDNFSALLEVLETSCHIQKYLIESEIALNDGDIEQTQKDNEKAKQLIKVLITDSFEEVKEELSLSQQDVDDYDLPSNLELVKQIAIINQSISEILALHFNQENDDSLQTISKNRLSKAIETFTEIANSLYFN